MNAREAKEKLPARIKVRIRENAMGSVIVSCHDAMNAHLVSATNEYNGSCEIWMDNSQDVRQFLSDYPKSRYRIAANEYGEGYKIGRYTYAVNDNATFMIDSWDFRHMVGGQCD